MFYGHVMFIGNCQKEAIYLSLSSPVYHCRVDQTVSAAIFNLISFSLFDQRGSHKPEKIKINI